MKILFIASEIYPLVKTGGLADVAGCLPVALRKQGEDVRLLMPCYRGILEKVSPVQKSTNLGNPFGVGDLILLETSIPESDTPIWLLQCQSLFEREGGPYLDDRGVDFDDNHLRFCAFSWAAATIAAHGNLMGWQPDVLHINDWQSGFAAAYLASWKVKHIPIVSTIHNLRYNGSFPLSKFGDTRLSNELMNLHGMEFYDQFSSLKAAIVFSDIVTTVSPTYAKEILTAEYGDGLDGTLKAHQYKLRGILNGVDYEQWNPAIDPLIAHRYDQDSLNLKTNNKLALLEENQLPQEPDQMIFGVVSRLTEQKGLDLVLDAIPSVLDQGAKLIVLGSGDVLLEKAFQSLQEHYPNQVSIRIGYDEAYSHRLQAGVDCLLIPSRFEPCGLTQLYALKYGTLPLVRHTGGLADTVFEEGDKPNGFVFQNADAIALAQCLQRSLATYQDQAQWLLRQRNAMSYDFSWENTTAEWIDLYRGLLR